jgi:hypothetical protein
MAEMPDPINRFFAYEHPTAIVAAEGTLSDGAKVAVVDPACGINVVFELPPAEFAALALLMLRAIAAGKSERSASAGYLKKAELFSKLKHLLEIDDPQTVARSIYRLRERLSHAARSVLNEAEAHDWSRSLIEHSRFGYRISIPSKQLHLDVLDAEKLPPLD